MNASCDRLRLALCVAVEAILFAVVTGAARGGASPSTVVLGLGAAFLPYAGVLLYSRALGDTSGSDALVVLAAAALGAIWLLAPPMLSDDVYRYVWEGRLWLEGLNPYRLAPDDPSLEPLRDEIWGSINNKPLATIYPPLSQALFAAGAMLGGGVRGMQVLGLAALVATVGWTARLTRNPRAALAVGVNPLLSSVSVLDGHLDVLVGAALMTAAYALAHHRFVRAAFAACAAVGLKVVGLVVLPFLWPRPRVLAGAVGLSTLLLLPLWVSRTLGDPVSGAGQFATRWRGNDSIFAALDWLARTVFPESVAAVAARLAAGFLVVGIITYVSSRRAPPTDGVRIVLWSVLLLSPQVHPWYLAWLLPLELAAGGCAALVWSAAVLCAYVPLQGWVNEGVWEMPVGLQVVEYLVVGLALLYDFRSNSKLLS